MNVKKLQPCIYQVDTDLGRVYVNFTNGGQALVRTTPWLPLQGHDGRHVVLNGIQYTFFACCRTYLEDGEDESWSGYPLGTFAVRHHRGTLLTRVGGGLDSTLSADRKARELARAVVETVVAKHSEARHEGDYRDKLERLRCIEQDYELLKAKLATLQETMQTAVRDVLLFRDAFPIIAASMKPDKVQA